MKKYDDIIYMLIILLPVVKVCCPYMYLNFLLYPISHEHKTFTLLSILTTFNINIFFIMFVFSVFILDKAKTCEHNCHLDWVSFLLAINEWKWKHQFHNTPQRHLVPCRLCVRATLPGRCIPFVFETGERSSAV